MCSALGRRGALALAHSPVRGNQGLGGLGVESWDDAVGMGWKRMTKKQGERWILGLSSEKQAGR